MVKDQLQKKVTNYFKKAASPLTRQNYQQESAYVDAFIGRLSGTIHLGKNNGHIEIIPSIVADRGPNSAESIYGADFTIFFESKGIANPIKKAILAQAKNCDVRDLKGTELKRLKEQCEKMSQATDAYLVLERPAIDGAIPQIRLGNTENPGWSDSSMSFDEYFVQELLSCKHGDRNSSFINAIQDSKLKQLTIKTVNIEISK
jgi:hypothetical protein